MVHFTKTSRRFDHNMARGCVPSFFFFFALDDVKILVEMYTPLL